MKYLALVLILLASVWTVVLAESPEDSLEISEEKKAEYNQRLLTIREEFREIVATLDDVQEQGLQDLRLLDVIYQDNDFVLEQLIPEPPDSITVHERLAEQARETNELVERISKRNALTDSLTTRIHVLGLELWGIIAELKPYGFTLDESLWPKPDSLATE